ncbi:S9 family peptidase [Arsenicicoccus piscis]|nr:S9 family peptidase [Arsenicicoccus piscis]
MSTSSLPTPPRAKRVEHVREFHGDRVVDPYEWLRDKDDPEVIAHLEAENAYTTARTEHLEGLRGAIYDEMVARVQQTDLGVPVQHAGWWYYTRIAEGEQYTRECRVAARPELPHGGRPALEGGQPPEGEQILVDGNVLGAGQEFFALGGSETTHDGTRLAYAVDLAGDERYALTVTDLGSDATRTGPVGDVVDQSVTDIGYGLAFSLDGRFVFYTRWTESWRQHQVWRHEVGRPSDEDVLVHEEPDELYWVGVGSSRDDRWIIIVTASKTTSEVRLLDAADPTGEPRLVAPRREGVEYDVEPAGDRLFIVHNAADVDYELAVAPIDSTDPADWVNVLGPTPGERIVGCDAFDDFAVVSLRSGGLAGLRVIDLTATLPGSPVGRVRELAWHEPLYTLSTGNNPDPASTSVQVVVESFVTPRSVYDVDLSDLATTGVGEWTLLKQQQVLGGVDLTRYVQRREWATAPDGTLVPVSIVHRQGVEPDGTAPGLLYGYGSYEHCLDPWFSVLRLSLLDRGFVHAVAHVRGGGEMGRRWYDSGKLLAKRNTFTDFIAAADLLVEQGWVAPDRLAAEGASAGGLLMGAVANLAPDRFRAIHAGVPFVDALNTILRPELPLTVGEWEEWGNPIEDPEVYAYMRGYTPYENIAQRRYPAILASTSLNDTRVFYVEPAKWVAALRDSVVDDPDRPVLLKTEMVAGHGGVSGRYESWKQAAFELAFLMDQVGVTA